ncbi:hypothetical protein OHT52_21230 [Streptomyces sp. NBC_00247]|uniref:WDGH domain-containing protein n=1 Tax=Streptomyces sp. NBC_00247 TaxID=2975689 RepID=UPI002E2B7FBD|nr:hypothetical protein [Streptomyces sp. NBC_00247]
MILAAVTTAGRVWQCDQCGGAWRPETPEQLLVEHEQTCQPIPKEFRMDRIPLDDLTSDQLDALYARIDTLTAVCASNKRAYVGALEHAGEVEAATGAVYRERAHLVAYLAALHPSRIGHTDPAAPEYAVVTVETSAGQMTWHIAPRDMDLFAHVRATASTDPVWDGHTTEQKYARLRDLTQGHVNATEIVFLDEDDQTGTQP